MPAISLLRFDAVLLDGAFTHLGGLGGSGRPQSLFNVVCIRLPVDVEFEMAILYFVFINVVAFMNSKWYI
jgi:hypothetical protein